MRNAMRSECGDERAVGIYHYKEDVTHSELGRGSLWSHRGRLDR
jgi:hypothetical protein